MDSNLIQKILSLMVVLLLIHSGGSKYNSRRRNLLRERSEPGKVYDAVLKKTVRVAEGGDTVRSLTRLDNRIYVYKFFSNKIFVFSSESPFDRLESEETTPGDSFGHLAASGENHALFLTKLAVEGELWKIQKPGGEISVFPLGGYPRGLSVTPSENLLVVIDPADNFKTSDDKGKLPFRLDIYRSSDVGLVESIQLPKEIGRPCSIVQTSGGKFLLAYSISAKDKSLYYVSEMSNNGTFVRTFNISSPTGAWLDPHLAIDEDDRIFITDYNKNRVLMLDSKMTAIQTLISGSSTFVNPYNIFYSSEDHQLIVSHWSQQSTFSVFSLSKA